MKYMARSSAENGAWGNVGDLRREESMLVSPEIGKLNFLGKCSRFFLTVLSEICGHVCSEPSHQICVIFLQQCSVIWYRPQISG